LFYFYNPTVAFGKVEFKKTWVTAMYQETGDYLTVNGSFGTNDSTAVATGSRDKNNNVEQSTIVEEYTTAFT
jgi:hypothetical protein